MKPTLIFFCFKWSDEKDCHIVYLDGPPVYNKTGPVFGAAWNYPLRDARPMAQVVQSNSEVLNRFYTQESLECLEPTFNFKCDTANGK